KADVADAALAGDAGDLSQPVSQKGSEAFLAGERCRVVEAVAVVARAGLRTTDRYCQHRTTGVACAIQSLFGKCSWHLSVHFLPVCALRGTVLGCPFRQPSTSMERGDRHPSSRVRHQGSSNTSRAGSRMCDACDAPFFGDGECDSSWFDRSSADRASCTISGCSL